MRAEEPEGGLPAATAEDVARLFRQGDPEAAAAVRDYVRRILRYRGLQIPRQELDDLEQESMAQLWRAANRPGFDIRAGFWGFVEIVTLRRCIDCRRRHRLDAALSPSLIDDRANPHLEAELQEKVRLAEAAVARIGDPCRTLLRLRFVEGRSFRELSARLGKSPGAVRVQLHRCVRKVQQRIAKLEAQRARASR